MKWLVLIPVKVTLGVLAWAFLVINILNAAHANPASAQPAALEPDITNVRLWKSPTRTRVVLDFTQAPDYRFFALTQPDRAVVDLQLAHAQQGFSVFLTQIRSLDLSNSAIRAIRSDAKANHRLRIVFDLNNQITPEHFHLKPNDQYGHRLVLDFHSKRPLITTEQDPILELIEKLVSAKQANTNAPTHPSSLSNTARPVIVAIDAGHGGEDPGAIGRLGTREKDVVLSIAKKLAKEINQETGMYEVLIRTSDYYIGLHQRRQNAQTLYQADLFISLHADAWHKRTARGASVFVLSNTGASSTRARYLAEKENAADQIGGVADKTKDPILKQVLVDLAINGSMDHSVAASQAVLTELGKVAKLHKSTVEKAGFAVLKTAQMPALLVELGFITNPTEERLLKQDHYQQELARALRIGIRNYFAKQPPPNIYFTARATDTQPTQ